MDVRRSVPVAVAQARLRAELAAMVRFAAGRQVSAAQALGRVRVWGVRPAAAGVASGAGLRLRAAVLVRPGSRGLPEGMDLAALGRSSGRFRTASSRRREAATVPDFPRSGSTRAKQIQSKYGAATTPARRHEGARTGGAPSGLRALLSLARASAAWPGFYRCRSRNRPCSPNRLASQAARRHGARRPPSSVASQRSTT